ncbi:E3 ubiquitin-protein ligase XBAT33 [Spatholobus suberectus]|nr:E3 ubiquitin-protein ligase XBAT33 [Spatholobus suberectus]
MRTSKREEERKRRRKVGNSFECSAFGERLVSAVRDEDLVEIVALLLENEADVNSRNYCGQTTLMQAYGYRHWDVVQTLLLFKCNVARVDYLCGRTTFHFAAVHGHVRCIRIVVADFSCHLCLSKFVNKTADGGNTAHHMAALNGYFDCVQLLLDLNANVSVVTFHYGTSMDLIDPYCTRCKSDGFKLQWGRHWLEQLLAPSSNTIIPTFPHSNYLSLPLISALNIAREYGLQSSTTSFIEIDFCVVCLERPCLVAVEDQPSFSHTPEIGRNHIASVPLEILCLVTCSPFPSMTIPLCTCNDGPCPSFEPREVETQDESPYHSQASTMDQDQIEGPSLDKTTCSSMFGVE